MQEDDRFLRVASMGMTRAAIRARPEFKLAEGNPELGRLLDILKDQSAGPHAAKGERSELALAIVRKIMSRTSET